ncbi:MAG TPA: sulfotransferase family 2 domain-containing protein [Bryobacteraceae bacterium]|nr:sulfotransferase family 2 domain-containing protein [Bryobacteraceae bacterium]
MSWIGCVDTLTGTRIDGWAADSDDLSRQVPVDIIVNRNRVATLPCVEFREDLRAAGIGDGRKAFACDPAAYLRPGRNSLAVHYAGADTPLPNGCGIWVVRRAGFSEPDTALLAALDAYHEFTRSSRICRLAGDAADFERLLERARIPFAAVTTEPRYADLIVASAPAPGFRLESLPKLVAIGGPKIQPANPVPVLAHIHVPKCAGTSLRILLEHRHGPHHLALYVDDTYFVYNLETLRNYLLRDPRIAGFSSHHVRTFPPWLAGRRILYVTFLRDPVQQFVSYMTHIQKYYSRIAAPNLLEAVPPDAPRLSLREFARWLLTNPRDIPFRENHNVNFFARHSHPGTADRLAAAQSVLSQFFFVGITEKMEESIAGLRTRARAAGVDFPPDPMPVENISHDFRGDLAWIGPADEVGALLLRSVELDRQLYDWAAARLALLT